MDHPPQLIPVEEHENYVLLWSLADATAKQDGTTAETCWLEIMDAFWSGKIQALYCFSPRKSGSGRALSKLPQREVMAGHLLGQKESPNYAALQGWTLKDYRKHEPFRFYTARDARFGLAISRADIERLHTAIPSGVISTTATRLGRFSRASAKTFAREYIARELEAGRQPTQVGLESAARADGKTGGRDLLRKGFHELRAFAGEPVKRGRRKKSPP